uniref:Uncharacterized protein n=1 Tax=Arundo donax TaxID=35708 RepID=A0A0A9HRV7_ARUDO
MDHPSSDCRNQNACMATRSRQIRKVVAKCCMHTMCFSGKMDNKFQLTTNCHPLASTDQLEASSFVHCC